MIERLAGRCLSRSATSAVIDVGGVGYGVELPEPAVMRLVEGEEIVLWIHTHVREDALRLFGFLSAFDRQIFLLLLGVNGVGPKMAMAILSGIDGAALVLAIEQDDEKTLEAVPGIGPRQSKKIILELKPKIEKLRAAGLLTLPQLSALGATGESAGATASLRACGGLTGDMAKDLSGALQNFGYKEKEFSALVKRWERAAPASSLADLIRLALAELTGATRSAPSASATPQGPEELF